MSCKNHPSPSRSRNSYCTWALPLLDRARAQIFASSVRVGLQVADKAKKKKSRKQELNSSATQLLAATWLFFPFCFSARKYSNMAEKG